MWLLRHQTSASVRLLCSGTDSEMDGKLLHVLIIRGQSTILCQIQNCRGNYYKEIFELVSILPPLQRQSCQASTYVLNAFQDDNKFSYVCLSEIKYKPRLAFHFLNKIKQQFESQFPLELRQTGIDNSFQQEFEFTLKQEMEYYNSLDADKVSRLQYELDQIQNIMTKNINTLLKDQAKLEVLVDQADIIKDQAKTFQKKSNTFKNIVRCNLWWVWVLIVVFILLVVGGVLILICGFKFDKC